MVKNKFLSTIGKASLDRGKASGGLASGRKHDKCVILSAKGSAVAEALERNNKNWIVHAKVACDLIIQVGDSIFQLHKLPMVSKSEYLNRLVFQRRSNEEKSEVSKIQIDNFPGGDEVFSLVVKFCYGLKVDLTATNIAPAYCAAHFLEMSDDLEHGNLISKTETFLSCILFSSWKDIFRIFKSCETMYSWAKELQILKRCSEAIAWKADIDPNAFTSAGDASFYFKAQVNSAENKQHACRSENWWFEDVSFLRIDHFIEVIESIKRKGIKSELVGSCIAYWTARWISQIPYRQHNLPKELLRVTTESLIDVLPKEQNSVSCNFLLHLLKLGMMMRISSHLLNNLEQRVAAMLEQSCSSDLLVKNYDNSDTIYDVKLVITVVKSYISSVLENQASRISLVGKLVDGYLTVVSGDAKLSIEQFLLLAEALPKYARYCNDGLYRAIDMYLKAHPTLTEEERTTVCRAMDYHKLSREACQHAMKNDRLPLCISSRLILLEQVNKLTNICGSNYQRTKTQTVIGQCKGLDKGCMTPRKEIRMLKEEVENMKLQLDALQKCKLQLQKQVKGQIV